MANKLNLTKYEEKFLDNKLTENANNIMDRWNLIKFKQTHPKLYATIIKSMHDCLTY